LTQYTKDRGSGFPAAILNGDGFDIAAGKPLPHIIKWLRAIIFNLMESIERDAGQQKPYQILVIRTIILL
jgi:hypothetical protein